MTAKAKTASTSNWRALLWTPGEWYVGAGGGYYRNFVPAREPRLTEYLARKAFGGEMFVSRNFPINKGLLEGLKPYVAADRRLCSAAAINRESRRDHGDHGDRDHDHDHGDYPDPDLYPGHGDDHSPLDHRCRLGDDAADHRQQAVEQKAQLVKDVL